MQKIVKDWWAFHNKESSESVLTWIMIGNSPGSQVHFPKCKWGLPWDTQSAGSPAARKASPFTFKQQNNNQWGIINVQIIHVHSCYTPLSAKPLVVHILHCMDMDCCALNQKIQSKLHLSSYCSGYCLKTRNGIHVYFFIAQRPYC